MGAAQSWYSNQCACGQAATPPAVGCGRANGTFTGVARKLRTLGDEESTNYSLIFIRWGEFSEDKNPAAKSVTIRATSGGATVCGFVCDMWPNVLYAGRTEQISAKARMAYCAVADDIDERGLAGRQCTFEGRAKLLRPLDVLTVTIHELEHPVVALVR